jgi:molybdopterin-synthase adenylyltransferase
MQQQSSCDGHANRRLSIKPVTPTTQAFQDDRYARHRLIPGFSQELISSLSLGIVGAGAIGNEVIKNLLLMGVGNLDVYDFDTVELSNLTRSVFLRESDVGINKAHAVVNRAAQVHPAASLRAFAGPIDRQLSLSQFARYDMVIAAVDNIEARLRINDMALLTNTPWINVAIDSRSVVVEMFPASRDSNSNSNPRGCYACNLPDSAFERVAQRYSCGGLQRAAYLARTVPTTAITASAAGALACSEIIRYLHAVTIKSDEPVSNHVSFLDHYKTDVAQRIFFDTVAPSVSRTTLHRAPDERGCPGCGLHQAKHLVNAQQSSAYELVQIIEQSPTAEPSDNLLLSDALIVDCRCTRCDTTIEKIDKSSALEALLGARAKDHTDALLRCPICQESSVSIDIRESLSTADFAAYFSHHKPDCAWLIQGGRVIDLLPLAPETTSLNLKESL